MRVRKGRVGQRMRTRSSQRGRGPGRRNRPIVDTAIATSALITAVVADDNLRRVFGLLGGNRPITQSIEPATVFEDL